MWYWFLRFLCFRFGDLWDGSIFKVLSPLETLSTDHHHSHFRFYVGCTAGSLLNRTIAQWLLMAKSSYTLVMNPNPRDGKLYSTAYDHSQRLKVCWTYSGRGNRAASPPGHPFVEALYFSILKITTVSN